MIGHFPGHFPGAIFEPPALEISPAQKAVVGSRLAVGIDMQLRDGSIFEPGAGAISAGLQDGQKKAVLAPKFALDLPSGYVGYVNKWLLKITLYS